jgi:hypothetical protein
MGFGRVRGYLLCAVVETHAYRDVTPSKPGADATNPLGQDGPFAPGDMAIREHWRRNSRAGIGIA